MGAYEHNYGGFGGLFEPSGGSLVVGRDEKKRSTKTWFASQRMATYLALVRNRAEDHAAVVHRMRFFETGDDLTADQLVREYAGVRAWMEIHQQLVEHFGSIKGFTLRIWAKSNSPDQKHPHESSAEATDVPEE